MPSLSNRSLNFLILSSCGLGETGINPAPSLSMWPKAHQPESMKLNSYILVGIIGEKAWSSIWIVSKIGHNSRTSSSHFITMRKSPLKRWSQYRKKPSQERVLNLLTSFESGLDQVWSPRLFRSGINTFIFLKSVINKNTL